MAQAFENFARTIERRIERERVSSERWDEEASGQLAQSHETQERFVAAVDRKDDAATLNGLVEVLAVRPTTRHSVRRHYIQTSVQRSLNKQNELAHTEQGSGIVEVIPRSQVLDGTRSQLQI